MTKQTFTLNCMALMLALSFNASAVDFHVQRDGTEQFCATGLTQSVGTYNFTGSCVVPPSAGCPATMVGPDGITRTLLRTAYVTYGSIGQGGRANISLLEYDQVWGRAQANAAPIAWPGVGGSSPTWTMPATGYVCAHMRTPANPAGISGRFTNPSFVGGARPPLSMFITTQPNSLTALPSPGAVKTNVPNSDANLVGFKFTTNAPAGWANLQGATDYWVIVFITNPNAVTPGKPIIVGPSRTAG